MKSKYNGRVALVVGIAWLLLATSPSGPIRTTSAQGDDCLDRARCGEVSPLIPMQSTEAVHMGLVWKRNSPTPKILFHARFSEYTANDVADPAVVDLAIMRGAFTTPGLQFNSSLRDVLHGFDPFLGLGTARSADDSFQRLTYGGYLMRQGLSQSVPARIVANRTMERQLLFDISHPDAFKNSGKFHTALLDEADFAMNRAAFAENGYSKGMFYNTYCNARTTLSDGRVNQVVPEVYDPKTDRNIALENARMAFPLYPQLEVVQTGPGRDDWKVCTYDGEKDYGDERVPGGARFGVGGGTPPFTKGTTYCLDVLGAMKDPNRNIPAKNHWTLVDTASEVRPYCCPTASQIEIDSAGHTVSHKWFMISGQNASGEQTGTVEEIEFTDPNPRWKIVGSILQPLATTKAVLLPDGKVLIGQGVNRSPNCTVGGRPCTFEEKEGLHFQMFDPTTGSITKLAKTTVSRGLHGTATLVPDGSVFFAGENREALVRPDDPSFPMMTSYAGLLPRGDPDQGVPVGQLFFPPYLYKQNGTRAARPVIAKAPDDISYGGHFDITVAGDPDQISSVVMLRSDHNTHSLTTGDRYVKLAFHQKGAAKKGELRVRAPKLPAQAVPGIYLLFVLDHAGVPSLANRLYLQPDK